MNLLEDNKKGGLVKHTFGNMKTYYNPIKNSFMPEKYYFKLRSTVDHIVKYLKDNHPYMTFEIISE